MSETYECGACEKRHDNYGSHVAHGLCGRCRDQALETTRQTGRCCRCGEAVVPFTSKGAEDKDRGRFLVCPRCGLVLTRIATDVVRSVGTVQ